ncbi:Uma2 family endonuclease [bacterium]|nr:MAG: Uma2 family endonuclease [bacterium]
MAMPGAMVADGENEVRWTRDGFWTIVEAGLLEDVRKAELIDGRIEGEMPQGTDHWLVYRALQKAFAGIVLDGVWATNSPPLDVTPFNVFEPEIVVMKDTPGIPKATDVSLVIEVSDSSLRKDLGPKKRAYAIAGVAAYWVFDVNARALRTFEEPSDEEYVLTSQYGAGDRVSVPGLGIELDVASVFAEID